MKIFIVGLAIAFAALDNLSSTYCYKLGQNCIDVEVSENQKLFDAKGLFVGTNNINDLTSAEKISLDYNLIEIESNFTLLPQNIQLISVVYNEYVESQTDELCSLYYNPSVQGYFVECIEGITKYNQVNISMEQKTLIQIPSAYGAICKQANSEYQAIFVLCQQSEQYQIINLDKKSGMLIQNYDLNITLNQFNQCSIKYKTIENQLVIGLFCCEDWEIFKLNYKGEKQLILNEQHPIFQQYFYVPLKYLLNFQLEYEKIYLLFQNGEYRLTFQKFYPTDCYLIVEQEFSKNDVCSDLINQFRSMDTIKAIQQFKQQQDIDNSSQIYEVKEKLFLLFYETKLILIQNSFYNQTINVELKYVVILTMNMNYFFGVDKDNYFILFKMTPLHQYYPYKQKLHKYAIQYDSSQFTIIMQRVNCYNIFHSKIEQQNFSLEIIEESEPKLFTQYDLNQIIITFEKQDKIKSNVPYNISMKNGVISNLINLEPYCNYTQYFPRAEGYFFIQDHYLFKIIVFEGENNTLVVFNCERNTFRIHHINFSGSSESVYFSDILFILDKFGTQLYGLDISDLREIQLLYQFESQMIFIQQTKIDNQNSIYLQQKYVNSVISIGLLHFWLQNVTINYEYREQILQLNKELSYTFQKIYKVNMMVYFIQTDSKIVLIINQKVQQVIYDKLDIIEADCGYNINFYVCIIVGLNQNKIKKYIISENEHTLLSQLCYEEYLPVWPLKFFIFRKNQNHMILIATERQNDKKPYLLFIQHQFNDHLLLDSIIECGSFNFFLNQHCIYYFDTNMQFMMMQHNCYKITIKNRKQQQFIENITQSFQFMPLLGNISTQINKNITFNIIRDSNLLYTKNKQTDLILLNKSVKLNVRDYFIGNIENITIEDSSEFIIQPPLKELNRFYCNYLTNNYCVNLTNSYLIFQNVITLQSLNYKIENQTSANVFYFQQILNSEFYLILFSNQYSTSNLTVLKAVNSQLKESNYLSLHTQIQQIFLAQNIIMLVFKQSTWIYQINQDKFIQLQIMNTSCSSLSFIENIYIYSVLKPKSLKFQLFTVKDQKLISLQSFTISPESFENQFNNQFNYPLSISFLAINMDHLAIDDNQSIMEMYFFLSDKLRYIFWIYLQINISKGTYELRIINFFDNIQFNAIKLSAIIQVCGDFLIVKVPTLKIFQLKVGDENIQPIYQLSESVFDLFILNTTHLVILNQNNNSFYYSIHQIQEWELALLDDLSSKQYYEVKLQAVNQLYQNTQIALRIAKKNDKSLENFYFTLVISNFLLIIVFLLLKRKDILRTKRKILISLNS